MSVSLVPMKHTGQVRDHGEDAPQVTGDPSPGTVRARAYAPTPMVRVWTTGDGQQAAAALHSTGASCVSVAP